MESRSVEESRTRCYSSNGIPPYLRGTRASCEMRHRPIKLCPRESISGVTGADQDHDVASFFFFFFFSSSILCLLLDLLLFGGGNLKICKGIVR